MKKLAAKSDHPCDPQEVSIKSFFLGPQAENISHVSEIFSHMLHRWARYRRSQFPNDGMAISFTDQSSFEFQSRQDATFRWLNELLDEFESEIPKFSPRYLGHMVSEISLPALYGSLLSLLHNPNNVSSEASRIGLQVENEAIQSLAKMLGYSKQSVGHFTSCGSIANLEAAYRAKARSKDPKSFCVLFPKHAHYSWAKIADILGLFQKQIFWIETNDEGRMNVEDLKKKIEQAASKSFSSFLLVSVFGTTEFGICDPLALIDQTVRQWKSKGIHIWHHVDAAYGGFYACLKNAAENPLAKKVQKSAKTLSKVDSITIDPHKLGYVPYAVGGFLCRTQQLYQMKSIKAPYIHKTKDLSEPQTIEGSRSAQGALSLALTAKLLPFDENGFGTILRRNLKARDLFIDRLKKIPGLHLLPSHDLNILAFVVAKKAESTAKISKRSLRIFNEFSTSKQLPLYFLTKTDLD